MAAPGPEGDRYNPRPMLNIPSYASQLSNHYWMLRYKRGRSAAARRRYYRYIKAEKIKLFSMGFDKEEIRLLCRYLSNPSNIHAEQAFLAYSAQYRLDL